MFRQRGRHGFRLEPGRASFDVVVRLSNPNDQAGTFLWWANPAVHVHDDYRSVFPADVHAVMDHGKRDVSKFPIADGVYYNKDYAPGTDISLYKNIPVPTSYMAYHSDYNFVGCYDHAKHAGMLHVANHHLVPGKKQWTWGDGEFGQAWDKRLTDTNGPYIELMCGAFTDNQPDFTWLAPGEEKRFTQTFLSYKGIGPASNASKDWVVSLDTDVPGETEIGVFAVKGGTVHLELWHTPTAPGTRHNAKNMELPALDRPIDDKATKGFETTLTLDGATSATERVPLPEGFRTSELTVRLLSEDRKEVLLSFSVPPEEKPDTPSAATPAPQPEEVDSNEELYLHGLHLEQYRHATFRPEHYYEEALRRDPGDSRCLIAMARLKSMRGLFPEAEALTRKAIDRLTMRNPNPSNGEAYYQLGLSLRYQERFDEAFDAFYKAAWSEAYKSPACFELARIACQKEEWDHALELIDESLARNARHVQAQHLRIRILREVGRPEEADQGIAQALNEDPLDFRAGYENGQSLTAHQALLMGLDLLHAGFTEDADAVLTQASEGEFLGAYFRAWNAQRAGDKAKAKELFLAAATQPLAFAFPNLLECVPALRLARTINPDDALAAYALGNFFYSHKRAEDARKLWETCTKLDPTFATAWRNLGLARFNKLSDSKGAYEALQTAFEADATDARVLYEWDQLAKHAGEDPSFRLERMDANRELCLKRDDLCVQYLNLLNSHGRSREALTILEERVFNPWEGGEGPVPAQYQRALFLLSESAHPEEALRLLDRAAHWPENLGEGLLEGNADNERHLRRGRVLRMLGREEDATAAFTAATLGINQPSGTAYYNDAPPETLFFQGLAWLELDETENARERFQSLKTFAHEHMEDEISPDYFAVSLPDFQVFEFDPTQQNHQSCIRLAALATAGLGEEEDAEFYARRFLESHPDDRLKELLGLSVAQTFRSATSG